MPSTSFFHGVTTSIVTNGVRTISVPSSSIIGLVDTFTPGAGASASADTPTLITSLTDAAAAFGSASSIYKSLQQIYNVAQPVIVAVGVNAAAGSTTSTSGTTTTDANALTSAIIGGETTAGARTGLQALLDGQSVLGYRPRLVIAPGQSANQAVATAMDTLVGRLQAIGIIDGPNTTDDDATAYAANFGSKRLLMADPYVQVYDTTSSSTVALPSSPVIAGMFAATDAQYGYWASPSNKVIAGITGTVRPIEFLDGDPTCRANLLNNANITTIIRESGFRVWGNRTLSSDPLWQFVTRVRTVDMVMAAVLAGTRWAVDLGITKAYVHEVTESVNDFMRDQKALGAVIDFEVYPDPDLNTASALEQGKIYWRIRFTDVPPAENPNFLIEVTDQWITEVLDSTTTSSN